MVNEHRLSHRRQRPCVVGTRAGCIPEELGNLRNTQSLVLSRNKLTGEGVELCSCCTPQQEKRVP